MEAQAARIRVLKVALAISAATSLVLTPPAILDIVQEAQQGHWGRVAVGVWLLAMATATILGGAWLWRALRGRDRHQDMIRAVVDQHVPEGGLRLFFREGRPHLYVGYRNPGWNVLRIDTKHVPALLDFFSRPDVDHYFLTGTVFFPVEGMNGLLVRRTVAQQLSPGQNITAVPMQPTFRSLLWEARQGLLFPTMDELAELATDLTLAEAVTPGTGS